MEKTNAWKTYDEAALRGVEELSARYETFLSEAKTERECVTRIEEMAKACGYVTLAEAVAAGKALPAGSRVMATWMKKSIVLFTIGEEPLEDGMNILGAHIDSPRMDIKQVPLYEKEGFALLDTHYYGGIKKYQWVTIPLAIHGVVAKKDGTVVNVVIGEKEDDPVFFVSDLLIHLSQEQLQKKASDVITGEALDIMFGNKPLAGEEKEAVKAGILKLLSEQYGVEEEDFLSAELEVVPAGRARDAGLDRSMILGYGHDDRVCAYTSLEAILEAGTCRRTSCCILVDKEEIGSVGATGMQSHFFENMVAELLALQGRDSALAVRRCLAASCMLSSDVSSAYDPGFLDAFDKKNVAELGGGMVFNKFTGRGGKSGSNDANAEYVAHIRAICEKGGVTFQTAELGRVDLGGGGTIAYILALYGMNVIDSGVPVLNMHAPWEAVSKADLYETKKGYISFLQNAGM